MRKKRIVILVDNPLRDLPACALLAALLAPAAEVFLTPTSQSIYEVFRLRPDLVLLNYLRESNRPLVEKLVSAGIAFSVLDTEGGFFMKIPGTQETSFTMTLIKDERLRSQMLHYFCWGEDLAESLRENKVYPEGSILCVGTPRMDFYHSSFAAYYGDVVQLKQQLTGTRNKVVLINTSFAGNNPKFSTREKELEMLISKFGYDRKFMSDFLDQLDKIMYTYIELTAYLTEQFPDVHFVLRPHPFENLEIYKTRLAAHKNVQVDCSGAVAPWLLISEALIHYECSTAAEAMAFEKPSLSLAEFKNVRSMPLIQAITDYSASFLEMKSKLQSILSREFVSPPQLEAGRKEIARRIYYRLDGQAAVRIAKIVKDWIEAPTATKNLSQILYRQGSSIFHAVRTVAKFILRGQLMPTAKRVPVTETAEICRRLQKVLGQNIQAHRVVFSTSLRIDIKN